MENALIMDITSYHCINMDMNMCYVYVRVYVNLYWSWLGNEIGNKEQWMIKMRFVFIGPKIKLNGKKWWKKRDEGDEGDEGEKKT